MKRTTEPLVTEITQTAKKPLYRGLLQDPLLLTFLGAPEALFEILRDRPIAIISLLQTNKAFADFWSGFRDAWVLLIDRLIASEKGEYFGDVYPFFIVQNRRLYAQQKPFELLDTAKSLTEPSLLSVVPQGALSFSSGESGPFDVIYYDSPLTTDWISLLQRVHDWSRLAPSTLFPLSLRSFSAHQALRDYLEGTRYLDFIVCLSDCFLVSLTTVTFRYAPESIRAHLRSIASIYGKYTRRKNELFYTDSVTGTESLGVYPEAVVMLLTEIQRLLYRVDTTLSATKSLPLPIGLPLDAAIANDYRQILYNDENALYSTPEKQKALLLSLLQEIRFYKTSREQMIEQYGHSVTLECVQCDRLTTNVDTLLGYSFCTLACRDRFLLC